MRVVHAYITSMVGSVDVIAQDQSLDDPLEDGACACYWLIAVKRLWPPAVVVVGLLGLSHSQLVLLLLVGGGGCGGGDGGGGGGDVAVFLVAALVGVIVAAAVVGIALVLRVVDVRGF